MPQYEYQCPDCKKTRTVTCSIEDRDRTWRCTCRQPMVRLQAAPNFNVTGYNAKNHYGAKNE